MAFTIHYLKRGASKAPCGMPPPADFTTDKSKITCPQCMRELRDEHAAGERRRTAERRKKK